ncbi:flagellar biosynthesis protein FlhA [Acetobacterium woodii]|uniref:Flagellar biosynthesis protein FlhA n=1 Tax=Acetobacterium woodii (strain ATCC 29683 / DSM 1030 / JCM 2381 / KCTC 1655 / WB1) TaxID=931626 RepID=H6LE30_ACEWD|nr:flagellar biosynthesis protein FlhA [Acetobacterium woodii]AFA49263.1 flagellar biosynthesis protein FlhA [Acetobacterium woodii DSM 1030]
MKIVQNLVVAFVIMTIALIIIPLPPFILDFMFILNISISLIILLTTMYIKGPLDFSIFPSMLLITTLLRLALNISSTRLILSNGGAAGQVIATFGAFVLGGNAIVGFIVFLIIVIVQFIVITKGAERISEVSARFTLDAMPGKQMSIDADLSSGAITDIEAKERRLKIQNEAEFYGSMDGATKLVKGDAIASMIIAVINLVAGTVIGMVQGGMAITEVITVYSIATVGDGLVSQVPALMISVATAMIVTRAASENNLNVDVRNQLLSQPQVLVIAGIVISAMAFIPGAPALQILTLAIMLSGLGLILIRRSQVKVVTDETEQMTQLIQEESSEVDFYRNIDNVYDIIGVEPIEMEFGYSLLPMVDEGSSGNFIDRIVIFRKQFAMDMGVVIPTVRLRDNGLINPNQYIIKIKGEEIAKGEVLVGYYLALDPSNTSEPIDGIETIEPAYGIKGKWITENEKELAEVYGYTVIDALSVIVTHMSEVIKKHMHELLSRQDINTLLENVSKTNPAIVGDVIPNIISIADFQKILVNLLNEGIPIRDLESILETLGDHGANIKDTDMLTEYVRQKLKRTITRKYTDGNSIKVIALDQEIETIILNSAKKNEHGTYLAIDPQVVQTIVEKVTEQIEKLKDIIDHSIILTSPIVRIYFKRLIEQFMADLTVLSFNEIDTNIQIQVIGMIKLEG